MLYTLMPDLGNTVVDCGRDCEEKKKKKDRKGTERQLLKVVFDHG